MCARTEGDTVLRQQIIEPALAGRPPFVLSDAFPRDWLPLPAAVRLLDAPSEQRKTVKRAKWISLESFVRLQHGEVPTLSDLIRDTGIHEYTQLRNTIGRSANTTTDGGGLFPTQESVLDKDTNCLTVYAHIEPGFVEPFWALVQELAHWGFGSDRSAGKGQFRLESKLEPAEELNGSSDADASVVLSTFQPAAGDPSDGAWEAFTKYGKLGPDFGLENVFKRPMIVFRPGACFRGQTNRGWIGRAVPMQELLGEDVVRHLSNADTSVVHWAFGLSVPFHWPQGSLRCSEPATAANESAPPRGRELPRVVQSNPLQAQDPDQVTVKVLKRRDIGGGVQFLVQEEGKPRGVLAYGVPPAKDKLPQAGDEIPVYRNNQDSRNPQYRWDKPVVHLYKKKGGSERRPRKRR